MFLVKVSLTEYISLTTHQKAFIFEPWVPERVIFYAMSFDFEIKVGHCDPYFLVLGLYLEGFLMYKHNNLD